MSQEDQVVSVRMRRKNTGIPWGFRMHGGAEYSSPIFIQHVNPKSLALRQGLRINDRLLAVGNTPTHHLTHEQVKMEIIRAGNELDFVVSRSASGVDQQDSRPSQKAQTEYRQYDDPEEEPSQYRGYTNPKVQSRSFKILQESLSYTEADEEGIILPSGHTPGEGVVLRAYNEGRRRKEELAEISPGMFIKESPLFERGQNLLKCSEEDEEIIAKLKCSWRSKEPEVAKAKSYTPGTAASQTQQAQSSQGVDLSGSSVLAPAAAQKQYLEQAHAYYGDQNAPTIQVAVQHQPVQPSVQQPVQAHPQQAPRRRERRRPQKEQSAQKIQSPVSVAQTSGFIPTTDTVSSVAEELNLKHGSTVEQANLKVRGGPKQAETMQVTVQSVQNIAASSQSAEKQQVRVETVVVAPVVEKTEPKPTPKSEAPAVEKAETKPIPKPEAATVEKAEPKPTPQSETPAVEKTEPKPTPTPEAPAVEKAEPKPTPKPEELPTVQSSVKQDVKTETVIVSASESSVKEVKVNVDTVDATVIPSGDVIREYGDRMAEAVISESLQDASAGIRDVTDGSSVSKAESKQEQTSDGGTDVATVEVVQIVAETPEPVQEQEPEPKNEAGKSEPEPKVEETGASNQSTVVIEKKPDENVVQVETSKSEVVVEAVTVSEEKPIDDTSVSVTLGEVSTEDLDATVALPAEEATEVQAVIEAADTTATSVVIEDSSANTVVTDVNVSESISTEENVQVSIGETEASFVIGGGEEESSFVVSVQEEVSQDATGEVQSETFDISFTEGTEETANITLDLSADVTIDADVSTADDTTEVSLSLESSETAETVIVQESKEPEPKEVKEGSKPEPKVERKGKEPEPKTESKKEAAKSEQPVPAKTETKTDSTKTDSAPPKKAKFVDSQGGVSARLARFNLKKK